jgi:hypothetical protein
VFQFRCWEEAEDSFVGPEFGFKGVNVVLKFD